MQKIITAIKLPSGWYADLTNENKVCYNKFSTTKGITDKDKELHFINYVNALQLIVKNQFNFEFRNKFWFNIQWDEKEPHLTKNQIEYIKRKYER